MASIVFLLALSVLENYAFVIELVSLEWDTVASVQQVLKRFCLLCKGNDLDYLAPFSLKRSNATLVAYFLR